MSCETKDPRVRLIVEHLRDPQVRAALQSVIGEVLNVWLNLDTFCPDGRAMCKRSVRLARLHELLQALSLRDALESDAAGFVPGGAAAS